MLSKDPPLGLAGDGPPSSKPLVMLNLSKSQLKKLADAVQASGARLYREPVYETVETLVKSVDGVAEESPKYPGSYSVKVKLDGKTAYFTCIGDPDATSWRLVSQAARVDDPEYGIVAGQVRLAAIAL